MSCQDEFDLVLLTVLEGEEKEMSKAVDAIGEEDGIVSEGDAVNRDIPDGDSEL